MARWMTFSLAAAVLWGFWALLFKLGTAKMSNLGAKVWETAGYAFSTIPILLYVNFSPVWNGRGFVFSILGGATGGLANYFFLTSFQRGGKASVVTALVATCPVLTIACAYAFLGEHVTARQAAGCACAIAAAVLMSE